MLLLLLKKFSKMVKFYIMEYQGVTSQHYYSYLKVQLANTSYDSNNYLADHENSHASVTTLMIIVDMLPEYST
jgi:hypothetical protein